MFESSALVIIKRMYEAKGMVLNPEDYVFTNILTRKRQGPGAFNTKFNQLKAHLNYGDEYTLYSTRLVYISDRIVNGTPLSLIAQNCGNSTRMIEERYQDIMLKVNSAPLIQRHGQEESFNEFMPLV